MREIPDKLGEFEIRQRLGGGGMGDVYEVYDLRLKRQVAMKVLPDALARRDEFVRRFHYEATAAAKLAHPNIVPIHHVGEDQGFHFFVMELIRGEPLANIVGEPDVLSLDQRLDVIQQCLSGLAAAHEADLVHRDIKPANILLESDTKRSVIVDFGLVKHTAQSDTQLTETGSILGTVDYISPEQATGQTVDHRSDLYSLGVVFYQLLAGRLPHEADTPTAMLLKHAYDDPTPLADLNPNVDSALISIVDRMLAKQPEDRFASAQDALQALRRFRSSGTFESTVDSVAAQPAGAEVGVGSPILWLLRGLWNRVGASGKSVARLQNTQLQVDAAIGDFERRRDELKSLVGEAKESLQSLTQQRESIAAESNYRAEASELDEEIGRLQDEVAEMDLNLAKLNAKVLELRNQRDLLNARLRLAEVQIGEGHASSGRRRLILSMVVAIAVALVGAVAGLIWLATRPARENQIVGWQAKRKKQMAPEEIDLLSRVNIWRDKISGRWGTKGMPQIVHCFSSSRTQTILVYRRANVPATYRIRAKIVRTSGEDAFGIGFIAGRKHQCLAAVDSGKGRYSGLERLDGKGVSENEATMVHEQPHLKRGVQAVLLLEVDSKGVRMTCDGKTVVNWQGDFSRLTTNSAYSPLIHDHIFISCIRSGFEIHELVLIIPTE